MKTVPVQLLRARVACMAEEQKDFWEEGGGRGRGAAGRRATGRRAAEMERDGVLPSR